MLVWMARSIQFCPTLNCWIQDSEGLAQVKIAMRLLNQPSVATFVKIRSTQSLLFRPAHVRTSIVSKEGSSL